MSLVRRLFLMIVLAAAPLGLGTLGLGSAAFAADMPPVTLADRVQGRADAPVTLVEYASFTCPHCAAWHKDVYPTIKSRFIDTGRVRMVFRDLPTPPQDVATAAALIGRCAAPGRFFAVADSLFDGQAALATGSRTWFSDAIAASGRTREQVQACFSLPATQASLNADIRAGMAAGVQGTPTFFVNGTTVTDHSIEGLSAAIEAARTPGRSL
ncbi:hypothetical protein BH10PSE2_BH10PSE2_23480 [soil metagenome]